MVSWKLEEGNFQRERRAKIIKRIREDEYWKEIIEFVADTGDFTGAI